MSDYICQHGQLYASCQICKEVKQAEFDMNELIIEDDESYDAEYVEQMYDYYLDLDERLLREQEDN